MNNYCDYCTKLFGKHTCTEKDCPNCPVAKIISEHDKKLLEDLNEFLVEEKGKYVGSDIKEFLEIRKGKKNEN